jgi:multidrug efflux pump subunit AcrB
MTSLSRCARASCEIAKRYGASAKVAEIPPGPPVLSTLVAEVYAGDDITRLLAATRVREVFLATPGVVDVDWTIEDAQSRQTFKVDRARVAAAGANVEQVARRSTWRSPERRAG